MSVFSQFIRVGARLSSFNGNGAIWTLVSYSNGEYLMQDSMGQRVGTISPAGSVRDKLGNPTSYITPEGRVYDYLGRPLGWITESGLFQTYQGMTIGKLTEDNEGTGGSPNGPDPAKATEMLMGRPYGEILAAYQPDPPAPRERAFGMDPAPQVGSRAFGMDPAPQVGSRAFGMDPAPQVGSRAFGMDPAPQVGSRAFGIDFG